MLLFALGMVFGGFAVAFFVWIVGPRILNAPPEADLGGAEGVTHETGEATSFS